MRSAASNLPVMRFPVAELPGTHRSGFVWDRLQVLVARSYGTYRYKYLYLYISKRMHNL
jgi:hypothetical protein